MTRITKQPPEHVEFLMGLPNAILITTTEECSNCAYGMVARKMTIDLLLVDGAPEYFVTRSWECPDCGNACDYRERATPVEFYGLVGEWGGAKAGHSCV